MRCMRCCMADVVSSQAKQENQVRDKPTKIAAALTLPDTDMLAGIRLDNRLTKKHESFGIQEIGHHAFCEGLTAVAENGGRRAVRRCASGFFAPSLIAKRRPLNKASSCRRPVVTG